LEIAHADKRLRCLPHALEIERLPDPPDKRLGKRRPAPRDLIEVPARDGVAAGVKAVRHDGRPENVDVGRQFLIEPETERVGRQVRADVEVRDLRERVNAGIGPAGPIELEVLPPGDRSHDAVYFALDRPGVLLDLPAAVPRARVLDGQFEARHRVCFGEGPRRLRLFRILAIAGPEFKRRPPRE
jgi:hypothetical protein